MYYVIEIASGDAKIAGKAVYAYESQREAVASYHKKVGTAMSSDLYTEHLCVVLDQYGTIAERNHYRAQLPDTAAES